MGKSIQICAICGKIIDPDRENVYLVKYVKLADGRAGWISAHVRCARGPWPKAIEPATSPPGQPLQLPALINRVGAR